MVISMAISAPAMPSPVYEKQYPLGSKHKLQVPPPPPPLLGEG